MSRKIMKRVLLFSVLAIGAGLVAGCRRGSARDPLPPPDVTVAPVQQKEIVEWSEFTGQVEPVQSVNVRPRVAKRAIQNAGAHAIEPISQLGLAGQIIYKRA